MKTNYEYVLTNIKHNITINGSYKLIGPNYVEGVRIKGSDVMYGKNGMQLVSSKHRYLVVACEDFEQFLKLASSYYKKLEKDKDYYTGLVNSYKLNEK